MKIKIKTEWLTREKEKIEKRRLYLHFDEKLKVEGLEVEQRTFLENPDEIARYAFWPLIHFEKEQKKYFPEDGETRDKPRQIHYPAHLDACILSAYSHELTEEYEAELNKRGIDDCVTAYRSLGGRSNIHFAMDAFSFIKETGGCTVITTDIQSFFDSIDHGVLKRSLIGLVGVEQKDHPGLGLAPDIYNIFKFLTSLSFVEKKDIEKLFRGKTRKGAKLCTLKEFQKIVRGGGYIHNNETGKGVAQGTSISGAFANVCMLEYDTLAHKMISGVGGLYRRYCDDIIVVLPLNSDTGSLKKELDDLLYTTTKLRFHPKKTKVNHFRKNEKGDLRAYNEAGLKYKDLVYLGLGFNGLREFICSSTLSRNYRKMLRWLYLYKKQNSPLRKHDLRKQHVHPTENNFTKYGFRAASTLNSKLIRRQLTRAHQFLAKGMKVRKK